MSKLLIISSAIHQQLSQAQRDNCIQVVEKSSYNYQLEIIEAGVYELPFIIKAHHNYNPFAGYIALGLILTTNADHVSRIMNHVDYCFTQFALAGMIIGNGIVTGSSLDELDDKINSPDPCLSGYKAAFNAVDCLIEFSEKLTRC